MGASHNAFIPAAILLDNPGITFGELETRIRQVGPFRNYVYEMIGHYTEAKDFIKDDNWRYRLYFTKWNEYVNIHTQYDPVVDTLIYFIDDEKIPDLNSNYIQQV